MQIEKEHGHKMNEWVARGWGMSIGPDLQHLGLLEVLPNDHVPHCGPLLD